MELSKLASEGVKFTLTTTRQEEIMDQHQTFSRFFSLCRTVEEIMEREWNDSEEWEDVYKRQALTRLLPSIMRERLCTGVWEKPTLLCIYLPFLI